MRLKKAIYLVTITAKVMADSTAEALTLVEKRLTPGIGNLTEVTNVKVAPVKKL